MSWSRGSEQGLRHRREHREHGPNQIGEARAFDISIMLTAMRRLGLAAVAVTGLVAVQGCATYTTPASGANPKALADEDIGALMKVEPAGRESDMAMILPG